MVRKLSLVVLCFLFVSSAFAGQSYVLSAGKWSSAQEDAVTAAGGTFVYKNMPSGFATVSSENPNFLASIEASNAFVYSAADEMVEWQKPMQTVDLDEAAINPANDRFYPIQWAPGAIEAPFAWNLGFTGAGVRVAVLDGGIFSAHPDLAGAIDVARSTSFATGAWNSDLGTFWHGTHVAGIIAARDNTIGVVGIAPEATIVGVKVLHGGSGSFGWVISGILYASTPISQGGAGADIINMSLGAVFPRRDAAGQGNLIAMMNRAINYASSQGTLVVSAAGNSAIDFGQAKNLIEVPGQSGNGIAVSATAPLGWAKGATNFSRFTSYSNYGEDLVYVAGPGGDSAYVPRSEICTMPTAGGPPLVRPCWVFDLVLSTSRAGYSWAAGTSMATPAVSAVAALIRQRFPNISLGALKAKLAQTSTDEGKVGVDEFYGRGMVNARRAVTE